MIEAHAWNEKLDLGHEAMDHEHHLQIALVTALAEAIEQGRPWMARKLAAQLVTYSMVHFGSEEMLMEASAFGAASEHASEHRALLEGMREIEGALGRDEAELALAFSVELRAGLTGHMAGADRRLASHVKPANEVVHLADVRRERRSS
jgi:hemerythrin